MSQSTAPDHCHTRLWLQRRNALWHTLRQLTEQPLSNPADLKAFETALSELSELTHWNRQRILAGSGLSSVEEQ